MKMNIQKPWQKKAWVQWLAIAIGILPYTIASLFPVGLDQSVNIKVTLITIISWSIITIVILLLLRFLCGERIRDLNLKASTWGKDILTSIGLAALTLAILIFFSAPISGLFPGHRDFVLVDLFKEVFQNPWLFALWIGPGLLISSGIGEEILRAFVLTRLWKLSSNTAWKWLAILFYAGLFGLGHFYQGPAGIIQAAIYGCIVGIYYFRFGRVTVTIIAHYLHVAIQFALIYTWANT